jgi:hypothetical protein
MHTGIVEAQVKAGEVDGALAEARGIKSAWARAVALVIIAGAQAKTGNRERSTSTIHEAFVIAFSMENSQLSDSLLVLITEQHVEAGNLSFALESARQIQSNRKARALAVIARARARAGDRDGASSTFQDAVVAARGSESV